MPDRFGFDARRSDRREPSGRRAGDERRSGLDRRLTDRRLAVVPVAVERRTGTDRRVHLARRSGETRRSGVDRRQVSNRRRSQWRELHRRF